jgi:hypothetical protein
VDRADHTVSGKGGDDMGLNRMLAAAWIAQTTPLWTVLRLVSGKGGDDVVLNRCRSSLAASRASPRTLRVGCLSKGSWSKASENQSMEEAVCDSGRVPRRAAWPTRVLTPSGGEALVCTARSAESGRVQYSQRV